MVVVVVFVVWMLCCFMIFADVDVLVEIVFFVVGGRVYCS